MKRTCDVCGKEKELERGATCEKGHFVCAGCYHTGFASATKRERCPICKMRLK